MNRVTIGSAPYPECATQFRVQLMSVGGQALVISTGAVTLQTYPTRAELRALGEMLLRHANGNEVLEVAA